MTVTAKITDDAGPATRIYGALTIISLALAAIMLPPLLLDQRRLDGIGVWLKPMKFSLSFCVYFATLALVENRLTPEALNGRPMRWTGMVIAGAFIFEMGYIMTQAGRAEHSHFNETTPHHSVMYMLMGIGAVCLVCGAAVVGWVARRDIHARFGPALREGVFLGLTVSLIPTLLIAGYLGRNGSHFVGFHPENAPVIPLFGWSLATGDLRPAHFLSLHAMQVLPIAGLLFDWRHIGIRPLWLVAGIYVLLCLALFSQALMGLPLIRL
ncbi:hypothetical protein JJJ17_14380 [Paracoccus caeni]|uniref:Uncharacterized protein n=1 Tax=Paracoccus caeni TaxID=657651 RepID=A0A934SDZ7_9RHOB|nr:hypothetical protein [Paracoccus caeni]MBK4217115.1 hypothetical protein [Paracoccus caeni]